MMGISWKNPKAF